MHHLVIDFYRTLLSTSSNFHCSVNCYSVSEEMCYSYCTIACLQVLGNLSTRMEIIQSQLTTRDDLPYVHNIVNGMIFPPIISQKRVDDLKTFQLRPDDVFVTTYSKSGSYLTYTIVSRKYAFPPSPLVHKPLSCISPPPAFLAQTRTEVFLSRA